MTVTAAQIPAPTSKRGTGGKNDFRLDDENKHNMGGITDYKLTYLGPAVPPTRTYTVTFHCVSGDVSVTVVVS